jgi:hypothetical protein
MNLNKKLNNCLDKGMKNKPSKSNDRYFQKNNYIERCKRNGQLPREDYLNMYDNLEKKNDEQEQDPEWAVDNLEADLRTTDWILEKVRTNTVYAQNLYAAMCNTEFIKNDVWPLLIDKKWRCSWRSAGGIIADMRQEGDYMNWYCSGIIEYCSEDQLATMSPEEVDAYQKMRATTVPEGVVTDEIRNDLLKLGWLVIQDSNLDI